MSGRNSVVECQLPKLDVAGSTPVARSKILAKSITPRFTMSAIEGEVRLRRQCLSIVHPIIRVFVELICHSCLVR